MYTELLFSRFQGVRKAFFFSNAEFYGLIFFQCLCQVCSIYLINIINLFFFSSFFFLYRLDPLISCDTQCSIFIILALLESLKNVIDDIVNRNSKDYIQAKKCKAFTLNLGILTCLLFPTFSSLFLMLSIFMSPIDLPSIFIHTGVPSLFPLLKYPFEFLFPLFSSLRKNTPTHLYSLLYLDF